MRRIGLTLLAVAAYAHGPLHEQIAAVTAEIEVRPTAALYLQRAELQRHHGEWKASADDYAEAARLDPKLAQVDLGRAKLALDFGRPRDAVAPARRFLRVKPDNMEGRSALAEAWHRTGKYREAATEYERAIRCPGGEQPELFLAAARAWDAARSPARAITALDEGMRKLGELVTLQSQAIEIERKRKRWGAALARVDRAMSKSPRKEMWLALRGDILTEAKRPADARAAYAEALAAIDALPPGLRGVRAMDELSQRVRAALGAKL